jgi:hypothetical protein
MLAFPSTSIAILFIARGMFYRSREATNQTIAGNDEIREGNPDAQGSRKLFKKISVIL